MVKQRKRRSWSDDEKREIFQQTTVLGVSVAQVARRYAMNANMIHTWLKDRRFSPVPQEPVDDAVFLPVEIEGSTAHEPVCQELTAPRHQHLLPPVASISHFQMVRASWLRGQPR
jgi:transposase